jgi:hypothetical protein
MKLIYKHSIDYLLQTIQKTIIEHEEDWHDRVTYQTTLGVFSFPLVHSKKMSLSLNVYLSSLLLDQSTQGQSFDVTQSQIEEEVHVYASGKPCFQISSLVSNWDKVRKTKRKHAQNLWLDPYRETWKTSLSMPCS